MAPPAKREPLRVLLVEDNALVSNTLIALLSSAGHAVVSAQNGEEGWDIFSRRSGQFDLVLADYNMPRLNGADLARRVKATNFHGRFILVSGFLTSEKVEELKNIGVDMTLNKPISSAALLAALDPAASAN
jgi:CheY-like chemotaxis protein